MDYCAEVSYIRCNNGYKLPMEIAFARVDNPRKVYILHMRMPHDVYFTIDDLVCNKNQCERRCNTAFNVYAKCILKMNKESWWHTLQRFIHDHMGWDAQLAVRSQNQKQFFKKVGGFRNVCIVNLPVRNPFYGCIHYHNRLVSFPCAAKAARTLAMQLNRTPRVDSKKTIQCKEDKPMDKMDDKELLEAIDKLLEQCDELMNQYPSEAIDTLLEQCDELIDQYPLEPMDKPLMDNLMEKVDKCNECLGEQCLESMDKPLVENTKNEFSDEIMKRGNETIKLEGTMECCEEMVDNDKIMLGEVKNAEEKVEMV
ncbi:hypothetical protein TNCT_614871 [Trichonephila clavata]|uniref:Uncharacterized protein n=1 Tax=Trichonephila clavata TaxID=2740835 RepID=A0A8X6FRH8_TRICU|nr:hypothetical protein TNCT_614871 [Trichonephila clavata]